MGNIKELKNIFARKRVLMLGVEDDNSLKEKFTIDEFDRIWNQQDSEGEDFGEMMDYYSELRKRG